MFGSVLILTAQLGAVLVPLEVPGGLVDVDANVTHEDLRGDVQGEWVTGPLEGLRS